MEAAPTERMPQNQNAYSGSVVTRPTYKTTSCTKHRQTKSVAWDGNKVRLLQREAVNTFQRWWKASNSKCSKDNFDSPQVAGRKHPHARREGKTVWARLELIASPLQAPRWLRCDSALTNYATGVRVVMNLTRWIYHLLAPNKSDIE